MDLTSWSTQTLVDHGQRALKVSARAVHLVDKADARNTPPPVEPIGLAPNRLRLRLHAGHAVKDHHAAIQHTQRALNLGSKIDVTWRINDVDLVLLTAMIPVAGDRSRLDGDPSLALLIHPVRDRGAIVDVAHAKRTSRVKEDAFRGRRLASINVRNDTNVAHVSQRLYQSSSDWRHLQLSVVHRDSRSAARTWPAAQRRASLPALKRRFADIETAPQMPV